MVKYTGSKCRFCRREGMKLFLKGERCYTDKCSFDRRPYPPGQHGQGRIKASDYSIRLREKQKVKRIYGLSERQFRRYFEMSTKKKEVATGEALLQLLERRLDNTVYRMGLAKTRADARQLVLHRHILVNEKCVNIPSFLVKPNDKIELKEKSKNLLRIKEAMEFTKSLEKPPWLEIDRDRKEAIVRSLPDRSSIEYNIREQLIIEFYSR